MSSLSERISGLCAAGPLYSVAQTRALETTPIQAPAGDTLMQRAGLALARLTLALAPHAQVVWVACGPGNNGGDGLQAAAHLQQWGKTVLVSLVHDAEASPADAHAAWLAAQAAGVSMGEHPPARYDICVDALFGIGALRPLQGAYADWVRLMNASPAPTLAVDIPTGLNADTGAVAPVHVQADHTLSLLTLKPGLWTGGGRDACGEIWLNTLDMSDAAAPTARLLRPGVRPLRLHASHKGSYGDVGVVGGAPGMAGAALLAARSALHGGAGRVFVCPLDADHLGLDFGAPELMFRHVEDLDLRHMSVVAGCGGGTAIGPHLASILEQAQQLVLDADALNHMAQSPALQAQLTLRGAAGSVITPHPLEAARLLGCTAAQVQHDRLAAARALAQRYQCVVVLKGSGTVIAAPGQTPCINPSGNAKLATAGTGDVLAGLLGANLACGMSAWEAACDAVFLHGQAADDWPGTVLTASALCQWP